MSLKSHIGIEVPLQKFGPNCRGSQGQRRCCPGSNYIDPYSCAWYGLYHKETHAKIPFKEITVCEFCALNAFSPDEVYRVSDHEMDELNFEYNRGHSPLQFRCDMFDRMSLIKSGYLDRKVTRKNGMQVSINIVNPTNHNEWCPTIIPKTIETDMARNKDGRLHIAQMPTHCGWEMVLKIDPLGMYNEHDYCFKIENIVDGAGRKISATSANGRSDFYTPSSSEFCVRGYSTGKSGDKFFFVAPTKEDKNSGNVADHHVDSSKFFVTVTIHKKVEKPREVYRGLSNNGATRGLSNDGATRGLSRGFNGGTNFSGGGYNSHVKVHEVDATFPFVDRVELAVQLVNREDEHELEYFKGLLKEVEVDAKKEAVEALKRKMADMEIRFVSTIEQKENELKELKEQHKREICRVEREIELKEQEFGFTEAPTDIGDSFIVVN